jgi:hypothetical protein
MFITRNAAFEKMMKKGAKHMQDCMNILKTKYDINTAKKVPGSQLDSTAITYARIAASFPCVTVELFTKGYGRCIFDPSEIFGSIELPRALFSPMMPSVMMKRPDTPLAILVAIAVKTDDVLYQVDAKTPLQRLHTFFLASYNATTEPVKAKLCDVWGICERTNGTSGTVGDITFPDEMKEANTLAKAFISVSTAGDLFLNEFLRKI